MLISLVVGASTTVVVAWMCAMWSPMRVTIDPSPDPTGIADSRDPDGAVGLYRRGSGFGISYMFRRGERIFTNSREDVIWASPWYGVFHRVAGWPFAAMRSRVTVFDSQAANRHFEGEPDRPVVAQRQRWELPAREIVYRDVATGDLPGWVRALPDRRLPFVPLVLGISTDTLIYGVVYGFLVYASRLARRRWFPARRGFSVITSGSVNATPQRQ